MLKSLLISIFLGILSSCTILGGIEGPDVVEKRDFESSKKNALSFYMGKCNMFKEDLSSINDTIYMYGIFASGIGDSLSFGTEDRYYSKKDVETCVNALYLAPCSGPDEPLMFHYYIADILYCDLDRASLWQNQHFGQGEWSGPIDGPSL
jgi:hypothetical protein